MVWGVGVSDGVASVALADRGGEDWDVWMPHPISRKKKSGLHPTTLVPAFLSLHHTPTKSNPDMRNSKLAHTQAGF